MPEFLRNKLQALSLQFYLYEKKRLQHKFLPENFATFFRGPNFEENLQAAAFGNVFYVHHFWTTASTFPRI